MISLVVYCRPEPQGSMKAFMPKGARFPVVTSDNKGLKSYRQEVARAAMVECAGRMLGKHVPVRLELKFVFLRPPSIPKKRVEMVVRPDLSKILRATEDALTGIAYLDDAQIVSEVISKEYGNPERVEITIGETV